MAARMMTFTAVARSRSRGGIAVPLPFDPASVWGERDRYHLAGTIERYPMRGVVPGGTDAPTLELGPAWCRDPRVGAGATLLVSLYPEGPQLDSLSADIADAISADPRARRFFESLATHYRNGYVTWVESAKRPETRARRVDEVVSALVAGRRARD
jgi:Bacteriocin-protection, YdeI or OmpD-Associated